MAHTTDPTVVGDRRARRPAAAAPRWAWPLTLLLSCAGLGVSLYLTWVHYTEPLQLSCPATGIINCVRVTTSSQSEIGGVIPVAVTGIVFFAAMTVLCCPAAWRARSATLHRLRLIGVTAGLGMVLYLVYVELIELHAVCLWCSSVHVLTFALFCSVAAAAISRTDDGRSLDDDVDGAVDGGAAHAMGRRETVED
jgi:uncharacterized membrane protein